MQDRPYNMPSKDRVSPRKVLAFSVIVILTTICPLGAQQTQPFESIALRGLPIKTPDEGITFDEKDLYYQTILQIQELPEEDLKSAADRFETQRRAVWSQSDRSAQTFSPFADLYFHPEAYQGHPLTLHGHLQRLVRLPPDDNYPASPALYEAWLFPDDAQQNPVVVICGQIPSNWPLGDVTIDHVQATGIFYRHYTYRGQDEKRYAPLLIAQRLEESTSHLAQPADESKLWKRLLLITLAAVLFLPPLIYLTMRRPTELPFESLIATDEIGPPDSKSIPTQENWPTQEN